MFFRRKSKLRTNYDKSFLDLMKATKEDWVDKRSIESMSFEQNFDLSCQTKLAEAKYFFLFKEAKNRKIVIKR
ncbi:YaaL family protein [Bacillus spongiae]|uniref:YaaL family protein n=1 Tax=Bacillus spongiae TaxID=2683610 RepID=A0ABU8HJU5_9BACI